MNKLSAITKTLEQSYIRSVTARINEVNGVNLGQGICDLPTPQPIRESAQEAIEQGRSIYSYYGGIEPLRELILEKVRTFNKLPVRSTDQIMVGNGATGSFVTAMFALLNPGDEVILFEPFYICAPTPLQYGLLGADKLGPSYFEELKIDYAKKRQMLCSTLEKIGFNVPWPEGAYYVFASFKPLSGKINGFDNDREACETLIEKAGVGSVPGSSFYSNPEDGRFYLRFCYAKKIQDLEKACKGLLQILK